MNVRRRDEMTSITEQTRRQKDRQQAQQSNATNAGDGLGESYPSDIIFLYTLTSNQHEVSDRPTGYIITRK